jgi:ATP-dependent helicase/nuclease subunit A
MPETDDDTKLAAYVNTQLESMVKCGKIQKAAVQGAVRVEDIVIFLRSPAGRQMQQAAVAGRLHREQPFVLRMRADRVNPDWPPERDVLVRGIIDAWFTTPDGQIVLLDYKTDQVAGMEDPEEELIRRYRIQLAIYREALMRLCGRTVSQTLLYSFALGKEIQIGFREGEEE